MTLFIASDAIPPQSQISIVNDDSCPDLDRWLRQRRSGIFIEFRRIVRVNSGLPCLKDYFINLSVFEEEPMIGRSDGSLNQIYRRVDDQFSIVVKTITLSECVGKLQVENEIENLINLQHHCITGPIGFVFPSESAALGELKIGRLYVEGFSLAEVISISPEWWTATAKAKAVAGIVLGLRAAHNLGLFHGHLTASNILFDTDHRVQITDFGRIRLEMGENKIGCFSGEGWTLKTDVDGFVSLFSEIMFGRPADGTTLIDIDVPFVVSQIMKSGFCSESEKIPSFNDILNLLKMNGFRITADVDSANVSAFVRWVESADESE
jgi:serine/threonine protein kinase